MVGFHPTFSRHVRADASSWLKEKVGFSRQGNSNSFVLSLFSVGHAATMPDRNNYANNDVGILYRLYLMYLMYVHNYSAQSVDSSERMIVMLCAYLNSFPYRIFIFLLFICLIRVQRYKNSAKSFCVAAKKWYKHADFNQNELFSWW